MLPKLCDLLLYNNAAVKARYYRNFPASRLTADEAFDELLKYFWLYLKHRQEQQRNPDNPELNFSCVMHVEMLDIDNMWHTFLLHTRDYYNFCMHYFNEFIHHQPIAFEQAAIEANPIELHYYLSYIYENLGEATLKKWFNE